MAYKAFLVAANMNKNFGFTALPNALNDVKEVKRLLKEEPSNFRYKDIQEYTGVIAKKNVIKFALADFFKSATKDDVLICYWAGHGYLYEGEGYLVPFDGDMYDVTGTMIKMEEVRQWIESSEAKVVITLLDTCHSGAITRGKGLFRGLEINGAGKVIIAACQPSQPAHDRKGHGAFSDYFIQGLSGSAANVEGVIDVYTLYAFIANKLESEFEGRQIPVLHSSTLEGAPIEIKRLTQG